MKWVMWMLLYGRRLRLLLLLYAIETVARDIVQRTVRQKTVRWDGSRHQVEEFKRVMRCPAIALMIHDNGSVPVEPENMESRKHFSVLTTHAMHGANVSRHCWTLQVWCRQCKFTSQVFIVMWYLMTNDNYIMPVIAARTHQQSQNRALTFLIVYGGNAVVYRSHSSRLRHGMVFDREIHSIHYSHEKPSDRFSTVLGCM